MGEKKEPILMLGMGMWHDQTVFKLGGQVSRTDDVDLFLDLYSKPSLITTLDLVYTPLFQKEVNPPSLETVFYHSIFSLTTNATPRSLDPLPLIFPTLFIL